MANLIQIAEELEYMPKDQLAQMIQDPNSTYPQFLVLSEIQRRTQLEKAYQAQATQAEPQTTVAEETVTEFMAPQGLQGMAEQPMPQDMPAPPMQMAANGGRTGFMTGGNSPRSILLSTMGANPSGMTDQEMGGLITRMNQESEQMPARRSFGLMEGEIVPEVVEEEEEMMAKGGRIGYQNLGYTGLRQARNLDYSNIDPSMIDPRWGGIYDVYQQSGQLKRKALLESLGIDASGMSEDEIQQALLFAGQPRDKGGTIIRYPETADISQNFKFEPTAEEIQERERLAAERDENWLAGAERRNAERDERISTGDVLIADIYEQTPSGSGSLLSLEQSGLDEKTYNKLLAKVKKQNKNKVTESTSEQSKDGGIGMLSKLFPYGVANTGSELNPYTPFPQGSSENIPTQDEINTAVDSAESRVRKGLRERYMDDDGTVDWSQTLSDASLLYPGALVARASAKWAAPKVATWGTNAWKNRNKLWTKKNPNFKTKKDGTPDLRFKNNPERVIDPKKRNRWIAGLSLVGGLGAQTNQQLEEWGDAKLTKEEEERKKRAAAAAAAEAAAAAAANDANNNNAGTQIETTKKSGPFSNITADQGLTMAQLGGVLMGARNMSELGTGIAGVASQAQDRRSAAGLAGAQQSYYESQAEQAKAEVAAMPEEQRIAELKQYQAFADQLSEGEISLTPEELKVFNAKYRALLGIETQGDEDFLKGTKAG